MKGFKGIGFAVPILILILSIGCAGPPVRDAVKVDLTLPVGKIEGNQFTGIRFPFKVAAPPGWRIAMEYPKFMLDLGFEKEGLAESEVFLFNPDTKSNVQIDFAPAGRYAKFDQPTMEALVSSVTDEFKDEVKQEMGKDIKVEVGPTEPVKLKGVSYAAKKSGIYSGKGTKREQGWIYAFTEPYQIFILYMIVEKEGVDDRQGVKAVLDSFEYQTPGSK